MAVTLASDEAITAPQMGSGGAPRPKTPRGRNFEEAMAGRAAELVKGVGHITKGGRPLTDAEDGATIFTKSHDAILRTKAAVATGRQDADSVISSLSQDFTGHQQFGALSYRLRQDADVRKNFTATNMGATGAPYGLVPFDLSAPSRLIYPVYTLN